MMSSYAHAEPAAFPVFALVLGLGAFVSYVVCFALAASTKRLRTLDYVAGTLGFFCGIGWLYFLYRANAATLQQSFDVIERGGDPATARAINKRFKVAAGIAIALGIASTLVR
ncbi:hypothetical protein AKJ09_02206 [Labilithrix luteola]|uniref:Uncharacterized protein n=1 Tax=Labilithrix luteola TaxID=1391654 RepID=A0A0K1PPU5_9BACT|nr:hypothetical protein [Labilithrix luteola]AKU95542.1 hypothetical protein AKJ09_02206 [Labilithrix luteola]